MVNATAAPYRRAIATSAVTNCVVKLTFTIDTTCKMPHRKGNAAAYEMCAGLAFPNATHTKGGI